VTTIVEILTAQARTRPDAAALVEAGPDRGRRMTFAELETAVGRAAEELAGLGLRRGEAVLVFVPMSVDLYVALLAMFRLGVVAIFLDPSAGRAHLERCCARWPPRALLAVPRAHLLRLVSPALRSIPLKLVSRGWVPAARRWPTGAAQGSVTPERRDAPTTEDPALVTFTSGSTGTPKAAVRTQGFLVAQHRVLAPAIALQAGDVDLATLPVFTLANLASGVTTVIPSVDLRRPGAVDGAQVWADLERHEVTRVTASPAFFERLIAHGRSAGRTLPGLRQLYTGGAPVFPRLLEALQALAPNAAVVAVYGSTEAEPIAHLEAREITPADRRQMQAGRGLLAGMPVPEIQVRVLRDRWGEPRGELSREEFAAERLPLGEVGEIVVAGDHVQRGYLGGVGDEETKFWVDGVVWHRTGDAGWIDDTGRLWLLGRCGAKIDDGLGRIYPLAVECVAMTFPEVRRAAVVAQRGRRVVVVEAPARVGPELQAALAWAQIAEVRVVAALPVDARHNAKIDYPALRRMLGN
jgi:acyl-CoA synthetase (AMP-forming)/AMP-acid ligase II